ncbi:CACTA en-spm transposon protein [Cucumis melo var. makuwa]|uniref:CACTA en-spm transposon protein n=1 Tax=Cucumis melo var. makuwa TaxID=1194695 RepID=A0A5A7UMS0_CUCMM|nr:CACTA en-spm transposon protein [Cucumis melo var. makuwa]TYK29092.1 CACTA en-spm transposon protein [Cucumis melo var. makuwa]
MTLCAGLTLVPQSLKGRLCVMPLTTSSTMWMNACHMQAKQATTTNYSIMSFPCTSFLKTDAMFLEFADDLDNLAEGSSSVGNNSTNGQIPMTVALGAKKPISPHTIRFSQTIGLCVRKTFLVCCLNWADVGREYIEVVKGDLQRFFVFDFNDQVMNRFVEHRCSPSLKSFRENVKETSKSIATLRRLVPTHHTYWWDVMRISTSSVTTT